MKERNISWMETIDRSEGQHAATHDLQTILNDFSVDTHLELLTDDAEFLELAAVQRPHFGY